MEIVTENSRMLESPPTWHYAALVSKSLTLCHMLACWIIMLLPSLRPVCRWSFTVALSLISILPRIRPTNYQPFKHA